MEFLKGANGQQSDDSAKLAQALLTIASEENRLSVFRPEQVRLVQQNTLFLSSKSGYFRLLNLWL
jgi:hypothetical protein